MCMDCWYKLNDCLDAKQKHADRVLEKNEHCESTCDDYPTDLSEGELSNWVGQQSVNRGVTIGILLQFTKHFNCWEWSSAEMIRKIIKPATKDTGTIADEGVHGSCKDVHFLRAGREVGGSCCRGAGWRSGSQQVRLDRWRWPSKTPDLDFASTISHCSSSLVVCSSQKEVEDMFDFDFMAWEIGVIISECAEANLLHAGVVSDGGAQGLFYARNALHHEGRLPQTHPR